MRDQKFFTYSEVAFVLFLVLLIIFNIFDVIVDYQSEGGFTTHVMIELLIIVISLIALSWLFNLFLKRRHRAEEVEGELAVAQQQIDDNRDRQLQANKAYTDAVNAQFGDWGLTDSESAVARLLLKGLSFEEIAEARDTKEKTVRQQASAIYRKAGVAGRHEFAAWFFEDFLNS